jgi:hypothetical protein
LALCVRDWRQGGRQWSTPFVLSVAVLAIAENFGLMRDLLKARVPDAIVPAVVLGAWLVGRAWTRWPLYLVIPATFALLGTAVLVGGLGDIGECTTQKHRLFLAGMIPEVAYYARRPFAGGGYEHYNYSSPTNQQRVVSRLRRELVPFALIPSEAAR